MANTDSHRIANMGYSNGGVSFDVFENADGQDEPLFPTRANDLDLMHMRNQARPGQVVGPGAADYNMQEIDTIS